MKLVEVYNTFSPADAHLVCSSLQSAGFGARVTNEIPALTLEGYSLASGGVRVVVPEDASRPDYAARIGRFAGMRDLIDGRCSP